MGALYDAAKMDRFVCPKARRGKSKEEALASHLSSPRGTPRGTAVGTLGRGLSRVPSGSLAGTLTASPLTQSRQRAAEFWQRAYAYEDGPSAEPSSAPKERGSGGGTTHRKKGRRRKVRRTGAGDDKMVFILK